ncbi:MAG: hypothetical protein RQ715_03020 [Methylococcales bacterium]|nr:hypothetical protein [Methylococcales bacterium]
MIKKITLSLGFTILVSVSMNALATEYIYRSLMANTLPSPKCEAKADAEKSASKDYTMRRYSKKFCQTQGYGWHLEAIKDTGQVSCDSCTQESGEAGYQCHVEDVVVECKRIKPGSVGMLPGKG